MPMQFRSKVEKVPREMTDDQFGWWLAGLADGEGSFQICYDRRNRNYACVFAIKLRGDDQEIIEYIARRVALGTVRHEARREPSKPCITWSVNNKEGVAKIAEFFERYPLQSRKARDVVIWREAVAEWISREKGIGSRGGSVRAGDWSAMETLSTRLKQIRMYDSGKKLKRCHGG